MFNDKEIEKLDNRIERLERQVLFYTEYGEMPLARIVGMVLDHFRLRPITTQPVTKLEEIPDEKN